MNEQSAAQAFYEGASVGLARLDSAGRILDCNPGLARMLGRDVGWLVGRAVVDVLHPDDVASCDLLAAAPESAAVGEQALGVLRFRRQDGRAVYALTQGTPVWSASGEFRWWLLQMMEAPLQRRRLVLQEAQSSVLELVASDAELGEILHAIVRHAEELNPALRASVLTLSDDKTELRVGASPSMPDAYSAIVNGIPVAEGRGSCGTAAARGERVVVEDVTTHPYWACYQDAVAIGDFRACWSEPILAADGEVLGSFAMYYRERRAPSAEDVEFCEAFAHLTAIAITQRDSIRALRASDENRRITLESIGDAVITTDASGRINELNPVAEEYLGLTGVLARGRPLEDVCRFVNGETSEPIRGLFETIRSAGRISDGPDGALLVAGRAAPRRVTDRGAPIRDRDGEVVGAVLVLRDVSEAHRLQVQLREAHRIEAIGQLAAGVAHDFNNLLTGILGHAELLESDGGEVEAAHTRQIIQAANRAADLTRQLLAFSRKRIHEAAVVDVHALVHEVVTLLSRTIDKRIELRADLRAEHPFVLGDLSQLHSTVLNLAVNAQDAMPDGGVIEFKTRGVLLNEDDRAELDAGASGGAFFELEVIDTGCGMSAEVRRRAFEPFFTTKAAGGGTGLGLAGVAGTVESHGGLIRIDSDLNQGTRFRILLPVVLERPEVSGPLGQTPAGGPGHVLVVDDEEVVRSFASRALRRLGYAVTCCEGGVEAIEVLQAGPERFDVVILDLVMPTIDGSETFRRMRRICPDVRVLIASGFSSSGVADELLAEGAAGFLAKPYHVDSLARAVAAARAVRVG